MTEKEQNKTIAVETVSFSTYVKTIITPPIRQEVLRGVSLGRSTEEIKASIYDILTKKDFDMKAFDYVYESVKAVDPSLTRERYIKEFTNRKVDGNKINLFDNIDNQATTDRIYKRIEDEYDILNSRVKRLNTYRDYSPRASWDAERSVQTVLTDANHIKGDINNLKRKLRYTSDPTMKSQLKKDIEVLNKQYTATRDSYKKLSKQFKEMDKLDNADPRKMERYKALSKSIAEDIEKRKKPFEIDRAVNSSREQVKTMAKTEVQYKKQQMGIQEAKDMKEELKEQEILLVQISLNPRRSWIGEDICDEITGKTTKYGKGIYEYDYALKNNILPPEHPQCQCSFRLFKGKKK